MERRTDGQTERQCCILHRAPFSGGAVQYCATFTTPAMATSNARSLGNQPLARVVAFYKQFRKHLNDISHSARVFLLANPAMNIRGQRYHGCHLLPQSCTCVHQIGQFVRAGMS